MLFRGRDKGKPGRFAALLVALAGLFIGTAVVHAPTASATTSSHGSVQAVTCYDAGVTTQVNITSTILHDDTTSNDTRWSSMRAVVVSGAWRIKYVDVTHSRYPNDGWRTAIEPSPVADTGTLPAFSAFAGPWPDFTLRIGVRLQDGSGGIHPCGAVATYNWQ